jgi:hypothetical protein
MLLNPFRQGAVHHIAISTAASGNTTLLAGVAGKRLLVMSYVVAANAENTIKFTDATGDLTGAMLIAAKTSVQSGQNDLGHFGSRVGEALRIHLAGATQVSGHVTVIEIEEI